MRPRRSQPSRSRTFLVVYGVFRVLKPDRLDDVIAGTLLVNRRPMRLPIDRFLELIGLGSSLAFAAIIGSSMAARWMTLALYWRAPRSVDMLDPIFGRPLDFYLFTLPALQLISGWLLTLSVVASLIAAAFVAVMGGGVSRHGGALPRCRPGCGAAFRRASPRSS